MKHAAVLLIIGLNLLVAHRLVAEQKEIKDINTLLMHSTFKIEGASREPGRIIMGTVFLVGEAIPDKPGRALPVLITADHVLRSIAGENAKLHLRKKIGESNYKKFIIDIRIRDKERPVWVKHPDADVAVMYINASNIVDIGDDLIGENLLAGDAKFKEMEIHPGDELLCLGFPYGIEANEMGFPVLRSGKIASFPIIPAKSIKTFLYDFAIFGGNSGDQSIFVRPVVPMVEMPMWG